MAREVRPGQRLSDAEVRVLRLLAQDLTNKAIGQRLYLAEDTIKTHAHNIYVKLGVDSRAGAVGVAYERGVLRPAYLAGLLDHLRHVLKPHPDAAAALPPAA